MITNDELGAAKEANARAREFYVQGRPALAFAPAKAALAAWENVRGAEHAEVAHMCIGLSAICEQLSRYDDAESYAQRAAAITESLGTTCDTRLRVHALARLAVMERIGNRLDSAAALYQSALSQVEMSQDRVTLLCGLGVVYKYAKRFDEAETVYWQALEMAEPDSLAAASLWHNLGGLEHSRGRYAAGEPAARRSVRIRAKLLGLDHPIVAADQAALASLLAGQKKYDEAERLYLRALATFQRVYDADNYELAVTFNDLGVLKAAQGRPEQARRYYQKAIRIKRKILGPEHPDLALTERNLRCLAA
ncbi:tetratricopeptide repeat protein [Fodinicola feengrottensis]|uniref:Tetratricopeptide repeat protein n=1 Tax=Fodinicola feengrottensis TaxID=435914 RepID=A0ABN2FTG5_9ACTN|nr:tetratricopeptide repeat protein [Fodinicola feengrottensis]